MPVLRSDFPIVLRGVEGQYRDHTNELRPVRISVLPRDHGGHIEKRFTAEEIEKVGARIAYQYLMNVSRESPAVTTVNCTQTSMAQALGSEQ